MNVLLKNYPAYTTSGYGMRDGSMHGGIDIVGRHPGGYNVLDYILAKDSGEVVAVRKDCKGFESGGSYGNYIKLRHKDGVETLYAHMAYGSVTANVGDKVSAGQVIGYMGNTGTSYGGHLHFEVRVDGTRIDPTNYVYSKDLDVLYKPETPKKSNEEVAKDVIAGKYGNYPERKDRLEAEGYNYAEVQAIVNKMLEPGEPTTEVIKEGDFVIVNGRGTASSNGTGAYTRLYSSHKMKVIAIANGAKNAYALNQYAEGNVKDYSKVTGWFNRNNIRGA